MSPQSEREQPSERTPLLDEENRLTNGHDIESESETNTAKPTDGADEVVLAEDPDTKKLILTMSAIWLGVFFAALGQFPFSHNHIPISNDFQTPA